MSTSLTHLLAPAGLNRRIRTPNARASLADPPILPSSCKIFRHFASPPPAENGPSRPQPAGGSAPPNARLFSPFRSSDLPVRKSRAAKRRWARDSDVLAAPLGGGLTNETSAYPARRTPGSVAFAFVVLVEIGHDARHAL